MFKYLQNSGLIGVQQAMFGWRIWGCGVAWFILSGLGPEDPGSKHGAFSKEGVR